MLLGKADTFKNTIGNAALSQASSFKNAARDVFQSSTKTAISAASPAQAPAAHAADKKKNAKPMKATAPSSQKSKPAVATATATAVKPAKKKQKGQEQEHKQSVELLAKAEAFRQSLGHAVLSQMTAFKQAAGNAKNILPTLPAFNTATTTTTSSSSSSSSSRNQTKATVVKASSAQDKSNTANKLTKKFTKTNADMTKKTIFSSSSPGSLNKATMLAESLSKDVIIMKDALVAAFTWQPTTLSQGATTTMRSTTTSSRTPSTEVPAKTSKGSGRGTADNTRGGNISPLWGWTNTVVHPTTPTTAATPEKTSWFTGKQAATPEKTSWFTGNAGSPDAGAALPMWGWAPTIFFPSTPPSSSSSSSSTKSDSRKEKSAPEKTSWVLGGGSRTSSLWNWAPTSVHPVTSTTSAVAAAASPSPWGWNPSSYVSSASDSSHAKSTGASAAAAAAPFGWAPQNFGASSSSSSSAGAASSSQWNWSPTNFFPPPPSSSSVGPGSSSSNSSPPWSWNPTTFSNSPRVVLIAAGLIGCAYILGVAWKQATTTISTSSSKAVGGVDDSSDSGTVMTTGFSSNIYDKSISLGPSSNLFDGPGLSGAGAASAAAGIVGRSREELIAESQRRINAAKEALEKVEKQKVEAEAAAARATEAVAKQEQAMSTAAEAAAVAGNTVSTSSSSLAQASHNAMNTDQKRKEKSIADSFDMVRNIVHSAALVQDWGMPLTTKYDPLQNTIGKMTSSQSQWEVSDWAGPSKYCPVTDIVQGLSSVPPPSGVASKYDPLSTGIKTFGKSSWTGPARDRTKAPLREEKYDMIASLFSAIMLQKDPPLRKNQNKNDISWDLVAAALDAAANWQPPQPRSFHSNSRTSSSTVCINEHDKYDITASLMAGLYTITPPRMDDGGARWDPVKYLLSGFWASEWEGTAADVAKPVSPTYDPAAGMKGAEASNVRSKYDWVQAVLQSEAPTSNVSSNGGKRAWLMRAGSSLKENVPKMLKWKDRERSGDAPNGSAFAGGSNGDDDEAVVIGLVSKASVDRDRDDY